jgi:hypothetical protein
MDVKDAAFLKLLALVLLLLVISAPVIALPASAEMLSPLLTPLPVPCLPPVWLVLVVVLVLPFLVLALLWEAWRSALAAAASATIWAAPCTNSLQSCRCSKQ